MAKLNITSKFALYLFMTLTVVIIAMGIWWITLISHVMDEKVELAEQLGAEQSIIDQIHEEEIAQGRIAFQHRDRGVVYHGPDRHRFDPIGLRRLEAAHVRDDARHSFGHV